jgi:hypothetical protein
MQAEIDEQNTSIEIHILGVNEFGYESGNDGMSEGRILPWLQPAADEDIWTLWEVAYRDVVVLGTLNEPLFAFNLTDNDLSDPANYAALKDQLLDAANTASDEQ